MSINYFPQGKAVKILLAVVAAIVLIFIFVLWSSYGAYKRQQQGEKRVEELASELQKIEREIFNKKAADKIGGKTPQETLEMFIAAVEKGDYELASKYFVVEKQEEWKNNLGTVKNIREFLQIIKNSQETQGEYSEDKKTFSISQPTSIDFVLYPSGNWKIEKI